ncbi:MAG: tetratricopeptide repeat protein [Treponema sp.]|nr:tetratricopeptide repeat protein [Treponema sp.]
MRIFWALLLITAGCALWGESLPEWLVPLREALYEQKLKANEVVPLYRAAQAAARESHSGTALDLALSRCEYFMGRAFQFEERNSEARVHYREGMKLAEGVVAQAPSADAWVTLAENLSQDCSLGPWTYTAANGLNVEKYAKNALSFNKRNAPAQYLIAARWVFAPSPFSNHKKGIEMMQAIFNDGDMEKDDFFNAYSAIGYAYIQQKKHAEARPWVLKALEIYPTNKYAAELLAKK